MEAVGALIGVIVLLFFLSTFGWTESAPPTNPKPLPRLAADPVCLAVWNRAVPPVARQQPAYSLPPGAERKAWVFRDAGVCVVVVEGGQRWELGPRGWMGAYPSAPVQPNAVAAPDTTLRPAP